MQLRCLRGNRSLRWLQENTWWKLPKLSEAPLRFVADGHAGWWRACGVHRTGAGTPSLGRAVGGHRSARGAPRQSVEGIRAASGACSARVPVRWWICFAVASSPYRTSAVAPSAQRGPSVRTSTSHRPSFPSAPPALAPQVPGCSALWRESTARLYWLSLPPQSTGVGVTAALPAACALLRRIRPARPHGLHRIHQRAPPSSRVELRAAGCSRVTPDLRRHDQGACGGAELRRVVPSAGRWAQSQRRSV